MNTDTEELNDIIEMLKEVLEKTNNLLKEEIIKLKELQNEN